jgi:hypothetical protein
MRGGSGMDRAPCLRSEKLSAATVPSRLAKGEHELRGETRCAASWKRGLAISSSGRNATAHWVKALGNLVTYLELHFAISWPRGQATQINQAVSVGCLDSACFQVFPPWHRIPHSMSRKYGMPLVDAGQRRAIDAFSKTAVLACLGLGRNWVRRTDGPPLLAEIPTFPSTGNCPVCTVRPRAHRGSRLARESTQ